MPRPSPLPHGTPRSRPPFRAWRDARNRPHVRVTGEPYDFPPPAPARPWHPGPEATEASAAFRSIPAHLDSGAVSDATNFNAPSSASSRPNTWGIQMDRGQANAYAMCTKQAQPKRSDTHAPSRHRELREGALP